MDTIFKKLDNYIQSVEQLSNVVDWLNKRMFLNVAQAGCYSTYGQNGFCYSYCGTLGCNCSQTYSVEVFRVAPGASCGIHCISTCTCGLPPGPDCI